MSFDSVMIHLFVYPVNNKIHFFIDFFQKIFYNVHVNRKEVVEVTGNAAVRAVLSIIGKNQSEMAEAFGMSKQSMNNKFSRNSWTLSDLLKLSAMADCKLLYRFDDGTELVISDPQDVPE